MPHIIGILPCQLTLSETNVLRHSAIMLLTRVLVAVDGPFTLQALARVAQLPEEGQVVGKVLNELRVRLEALSQERRVWS